MKKIVFFLFLLAGATAGFSQSTVQTSRMNFPKSATVTVDGDNPNFMPRLEHLEIAAPGGKNYNSGLNAHKENIYQNYSPTAEANKISATAPVPNINRNFEGNPSFGGTPNDHHMCVSNGGTILSAINSYLYFMDSNGNGLGQSSLFDLSAPLGLTTDQFDPRCFYDPDEDKYILTWLHSRTDTTNYVVVAFSTSNDPLGSWNLYALPGNPLNNRTWTDYPMIAMTQNEVFITGNALHQDSTSWQTGFAETYIWQIRKEEGYNGDTLVTQLHNNIQFGGKSIRNLCPVKGADGSLGPNMYFLSERNFDASNDTFFVVEVTDTIGAAGASVNIDFIRSDLAYGVPPNGKQKFNQYLATNDSRVLDAFLLGDQIQFVSNSVNPATGLASVYHGIMENVAGSRTLHGTILGDTILDYGYPGISYSGINSGDQDAIITFNFTSLTDFAGFATLYYDGQGDYSEMVRIKDGDNYINILQGAIERWGDYSGSQRKYNEPGKVWTTGGFGKTNRTCGTWVTELFHPTIASLESPKPMPVQTTAFPNPATDFFQIEFNLPQPGRLDMILQDMQGKTLFEMRSEAAKAGSNRFTFHTGDLAEGMYFLSLRQKGLTLATEKIIIKR